MMQYQSLYANQLTSLSNAGHLYRIQITRPLGTSKRGVRMRIRSMGDCIRITFQGRSTKRTTGPRIFIIIVLLCCPSSPSTSSSSSGRSPRASRCSLRFLFCRRLLRTGRSNYSTNLSDAIDLIDHMGANGDGYVHDYYDGAMPEREEEAAGDRKLSEADESPSRVVDGADLGSTIKSQA